MTNRRAFVRNLGAGSALLIWGERLPFGFARQMANVSTPGTDRIDALCYVSEGITAEASQHAIDGGLTAAVFDLSIWPRDNANATRDLARWAERFANSAFPVRAILKADDFAEARRTRHLGIVLACQDASILGSPNDEFEATLRAFHALGLRVLQLAHNDRTPWGDSFMEARDGGLSAAGRALVEFMNRIGVIVDLSHCSHFTLLDAIERSAKPCAVTHAGCYGLAATTRNKKDEEILAIGRSGGFFGVFDMTNWLTSAPSATLDTFLDHVDHAVQLIGPRHVGFGSDGAVDRLDAAAETARMARVQRSRNGGASFEWPVRHVRLPELNEPTRMNAIAEGLARRKYSDEDIAGIIGGNFVRLFRSVCG